MAKKLRIVLATDLSARGDRPLERALLTADDAPDSLVAVHVMEAGVDQQADMAALRRTIVEEFPELSPPGRLVVERGPFPATIVRFAEEKGYDVIITGVARYNSLGDFVLGTAVEHLVRAASMPVLIVKRRPHSPYRRMLVATDFSSCSREALLRSADLFPETAITLIHAYHVPYEAWLQSESMKREIEQLAQSELNSFLDSISDDCLRRRVEARLGYGELQTVMANELDRTKADLLVLGTHGRSGFCYAAIGSWAGALLSQAGCDVLMIREAPSSCP